MKLIQIAILLVFLTSCTIYVPNQYYDQEMRRVEEQKRLFEDIYKAQCERMKAEAELAALKAEIHRSVMELYDEMAKQSNFYILMIKRRGK